MSSTDTPPFRETPSDEVPPKSTPTKAESLASFAVLADPSSIAGAPVTEPATKATDTAAHKAESNAIIDRLRSELQRRAKQIETLNRDLSSRRDGTSEIRNPIQATESGWKPLGTALETSRPAASAAEASTSETSRSEASSSELNTPEGQKAFESVRAPRADGNDSGLRRLLQAAHQARREIQQQLAARNAELEASRQRESTLRERLESTRAEVELQTRERTRLEQRETRPDPRVLEFEAIREECSALRSSLVEAQRDAAEARNAAARSREVLSETRSRVAAADAEASALRAALATNHKQAQTRECENLELQAALSIASETLEARRSELRHARAELDASSGELKHGARRNAELESECAAQRERLAACQRELAELKARIPRLEQQLAERTADLEALRAQSAETEAARSNLREALTEAERQRDALRDQLAAERQAGARVREHAEEREAMLSQLRETLASIGKTASSLPAIATAGRAEPMTDRAAVDAAPEFASAPDLGCETRSQDTGVQDTGVESGSEMFDEAPLAVGDPQVASAPIDATCEFESATDAAPISTTLEGAELPNLLELLPPRGPFDPPAVFRIWRDGQIAKKLAPLNIASADEFFASRIELAFQLAGDSGIDILSLGGGDAEFELRVARILRKRGHDGFRVCFPQASLEHAEQILGKAGRAGLDQELVPFAAEAIAPEIESLRFRAIISDGGISRSPDPESLVLALSNAANHGTLLAVAERIGDGRSRAAREMGDRIWQLMPERYKRNAISQEIETHYECDELDEQPQSDLLPLLRSHFAFEDFASFGHLVDRFVGPAIGPNFDPDDDRDRRFIEQIANLDEAKLDAGALSPLHMIARLTALDPIAR